METLEGSGVSAELLRAGSAVCTWPLNAFDVPLLDSESSESGVDESALEEALDLLWEAAADAPCEPGFWIAEGEGCAGLTPCAPGCYCPGYKERTNVALPCPAGTYGPLAGMTSAAQCRPCPPERPFSAPGATDIGECTAGARSGTARQASPDGACSVS